MATAFVGLGSNDGERMLHLATGMRSLGDLGTVISGSSVYETDPPDGSQRGASFNAAAELRTNLSPRDLLDGLIKLERDAGHVRGESHGSRTLEIEILVYEDEVINEPGLTIPHPTIRDRRSVLTSIADIAVGLADTHGPFADALPSVAAQPIRRLTGPYDVTERRWMLGLEPATRLERSTDGFHVGTTADWSNRTGDMFGAFLSTVVLRSVDAVVEGHQPSSLTYRFVHGIPLGAQIDVTPQLVRRTERSADFVVSLSVEGQIMGRSSVTTIAEPRTVTFAPPSPSVLGLSSCVPIDKLFAPVGHVVGPAARSWRPLERWDIPDLAAGDTELLRAWSPNLAVGTDNPYLRAAAILMPIDALIWPAAMLRLGLLGTEDMVVTPTLDFSGRFPDLSQDPGWHLGEVTVDHMTDRSIAGSIRVWTDNGTYLSVGTSHNLVIGGDAFLAKRT